MDKQRGRTAMLWSVAILHVWGSMIVWRIANGGEVSEATARIFEAICFGIFLTLAVIAGDKGLQAAITAWISARFGAGIEHKETTTTETVLTTAESKGESEPTEKD